MHRDIDIDILFVYYCSTTYIIEIQYYKIRILVTYIIHSGVEGQMATVPLAQTYHLPTYIPTVHT